MTEFLPLNSSIKQKLLTHHCEQSDEAIFILDASKRYLFINAAYEKLTGYSEKTLSGQPFGIFAKQFMTKYESNLLENLTSHLDHNDTYKESFTLPNGFGQIVDYHIIFQKLVIDSKPFYIGSINKISEGLVERNSIDYPLDGNYLEDVDSNDEPLMGLTLGRLVLSKAIANDQFEAYFQPKVELDTGTIVGFEALVRWQHPTRGLLHPKDFIDEIIHYNLSFALFCRVSKQVAKLLARWQAMGLTQHLCINADASEFSHPEFNHVVGQLIHKYNIDPYRLHIEMTESSLMANSKDIKLRLLALKESKICLALDDFGTGYASLSYLQDYPFDFIKIDKVFISNLTSNKTQQAIVKAILDLAIALDLQPIAEGIETQQQYERLQEMGCRYGQGYWLGRAVSAEAATQMLR